MASFKDLNDIQLLELLSGGSYEAFTVLYYRYASTLIRFANDKLKDINDTEDIVHDIYLNIWNDRNKKTYTGSFKAFLYTTVRNRITDLHRKRIVRGYYDDALTLFKEQTADPLDLIYDAKELDKVIKTKVNELPPRTKEIFNLSRIENFSITEIAGKLNLSEQTIKNQLTIALNHLRRRINVILALFFFFK